MRCLATLPEQSQAGEDQQGDDDPFKRRWTEAHERHSSDPDACGNKQKHPPQRKQQRQVQDTCIQKARYFDEVEECEEDGRRGDKRSRL